MKEIFLKRNSLFAIKFYHAGGETWWVWDFCLYPTDPELTPQFMLTCKFISFGIGRFLNSVLGLDQVLSDSPALV